jgi:sugar/nucleoside kinase (ribokinase family)
MEKKTIEAVVAGLTCLDLTPIFITPEVKEIGEILIPSKTVIMGNADIHVGGCVSNTGLAMCKFGVDVRLMGKVGNDEFGKIVLQQYKQYTTTESMIISEEGTAYSVVLSPAGIDRIFLHHPGGNDTFRASDIDYDLVGKAKLFHFGYPPAMRRMYLEDGRELIEIFRRVKEMDVTTSMDTCGIDAHAEVGKVDWEKILKNLMPYLDIFVPSVEELCYMLDKPLFYEWEQRAAGRDIASILAEEDVKPLADQLLSWGAKVLMIKCGAAGVYFATNEVKMFECVGSDIRQSISGWNNIRHFEHSFKPKRVLSATGAGDTCIAAFLTAILWKYPWKKCLEYAVASGATCVEAYDALSGFLSFEELDARIADGWEKCEKIY